MNPDERHEKQREARRRLSAQRARAGFLRGRVIAASVLCFGLIWAVVFFQMATGNDPVLSGKAQASASTPASKRHRASPARAASEAIETTEPRELGDQFDDRRPETELETEASVEPEPEPEPEFSEKAEVAPEPEVELEPLTTGQS